MGMVAVERRSWNLCLEVQPGDEKHVYTFVLNGPRDQGATFNLELQEWADLKLALDGIRLMENG